MNMLKMSLQVLVAFSLLNTCLFRSSQKKAYRVSDTPSLKSEFKAYGLPLWFFYFIGTLEVGSALFLLLGLWIPSLVLPAALLILMIMLGALSMHIKIGDVWKKSVPALVLLFLSLVICLLSTYS